MESIVFVWFDLVQVDGKWAQKIKDKRKQYQTGSIIVNPSNISFFSAFMAKVVGNIHIAY